eukprot:2191805-Amphidinium_carterae.1
MSNAVELHVGQQDLERQPGCWEPWGEAGSDRRSIKAYTDSDWATDKETRRSTSGGCVFYNGCQIHSWSRRQGTVALSSAEAELAAMTVGTLEAQAVQNLLDEIFKNKDTKVVLFTDSAAALAIASRSGVTSRVKHLAVKQLYCQDYFHGDRAM